MTKTEQEDLNELARIRDVIKEYLALRANQWRHAEDFLFSELCGSILERYDEEGVKALYRILGI